jgi:uncharacterized membrane protein
MHKAERTIDIRKPIGLCYEALSDFERYPEFIPSLERVERLDERNLYWRSITHHDKIIEGNIILDMMYENKIISWHTDPDERWAHSCAINLHPVRDDLTKISLDFSYSPPNAPFGELFSDIFRLKDWGIEHLLDDFRRYVEETYILQERPARI